MQLWQHIQSVRQQAPLVHNITNYVVMNNTANALLAVGASPIMAHAPEEVAELVAISGALVINPGTLDAPWVHGMEKAIIAANENNKPWVLDPVGAGASTYRNETFGRFVSYRPTVIRGNASEILALTGSQGATKGVDSTQESMAVAAAAQLLSQATGSVICISGAQDIITDGERVIGLTNGHPLMTRVTGMGCTASALIGAFCACTTPFEATVAAMALMGVAGEIAATTATGPGSFQVQLLDTLYNITQDEFMDRIRIADHYEHV